MMIGTKRSREMQAPYFLSSSPLLSAPVVASARQWTLANRALGTRSELDPGNAPVLRE